MSLAQFNPAMPAKLTQPVTQTFDTDEARWAAVQARDRAADGHFFYSVSTTGVFCRPSCAARPALRRNVGFHTTGAEAMAAGFRACKRCKPTGTSIEDANLAKIKQACKTIETAETPPSLDELSAGAGLSAFHFHRLFKTIVGVTPKAYAMAHRTGRIQAGLSANQTVTSAIYDAGYNSSGRFYENANAILGMTPGAYRQGGQNTTIRYASAPCTLGHVLVGATTKGICSILLGIDEPTLRADLSARFPKATLMAGDHDFSALLAEIVGFIEAPKRGLNLPLDVQGTAFQQRVWQALRAIPLGQTSSYAEIAQSLGAPKSARAVASACASNPLALAIPCHRVVRGDGNLSGYRWGIERKREILIREGVPVHKLKG